MGFAIICLFAVYGIGAMLLTVYESVFYRKQCRGCRVSLTADIEGGACCEWTARQLLFEARNGRLPIGSLTFYAADADTAAILCRLCGDEAKVYIKNCEESNDALRADYGDGDGDCLCQP